MCNAVSEQYGLGRLDQIIGKLYKKLGKRIRSMYILFITFMPEIKYY